jgi:peptidoglycan/xylan/chitin deacetylase (PgdA/CDA1 family)
MAAVTSLKVPVLMYHEIADVTATSSGLAVAPEAFADQLAYLHDAGFTAVTAGALAKILADGAGTLPERPVVLTFDDGYGDFHSQALPLLKQYGHTATVFPTTGWIGTELGPRWPRWMLNWRELSEIAEAGIEIGAHSHEHPELDRLSDDKLRDELEGPKRMLEDKLGLAVPGLSYPFGLWNAKARRAAREAGYTYAYAVGNAMATSGSDAFTLPRLTVQRTTTMERFGAMVNGHDTLALRLDRARCRAFSAVRRARAGLMTA